MDKEKINSDPSNEEDDQAPVTVEPASIQQPPPQYQPPNQPQYQPPNQPQYQQPYQPQQYPQPGPAWGPPVVAQPVVYAQPAMIQPHTTTSTTVVAQARASAAPQNVRNWSTGLCACCMDCGTCCFACCCWDCFMCNLSSQLGEDYCGPYFCGCPFDVAMRVKVRTMYGIRGTICNDLFIVCCCPCCAMMQLKRELDMNQNQNSGNTQVTTVQVHPSG